MRLVLENFIRFTKYEVEFPNDGLILLKGDSGSGKTTILKAIVYALWGRVPSQGKILTFNKKRAYVLLELSGLIIERWTSPKQLQLTIGNKDDEIILKDKEAQSYIEETIGFGEEVFGYSSWVPQKSSSSILTETPSHQLDIIRAISIGKYTSKLQSMQLFLSRTIKELIGQLNRTKGKIDVQTEELNNAPALQSPELTPSQLEGENSALKKLKERSRNLESHKLEMSEQIGALREREKQVKSMNSERADLKRDVSELQCDLREIYQKMWDDDKANTIDAKLQRAQLDVEYHSNLQWRCEIHSNYTRVRKELADYKKSDKSTKTNEDDVRKSKEVCDSASQELQLLTQEYQLICDWAVFIEKCKGYTRGKVTVPSRVRKKLVQFQTKARENITKFTTLLEQDAAEDYLQCPECGEDLSLSSQNKLQKATPMGNDERNKLTKDVKKFRVHETRTGNLLLDPVWSSSNLDDIVKTDPEEEVERLTQKLKECNEEHTRLTSNLALHHERSRKIFELREEFGRLSKQLEKDEYTRWDNWSTKFDNVDDAKQYLQTIETKVTEQTSLQGEYDRKTQSHIEKNKKNKKLKTRLNTMGTSEDLDEFEERYRSIVKNCENTSKKYTSREARINRISREYERYAEISSKIKKLEESIEADEGLALQLETDIKEWELLSEYTKNSEMDAVKSTMTLFNKCIGEFLSLMFTGDNMVPTVCLEWGDNKKIKTRYWYQDNEYSHIREFSGGEMDRLMLASVLTWNSIFQSKFLFLDESLSSLDGTNNTNILISLRDTFQQLNDRKLILVCSHEALTGVFDYIHYLDDEE